MANRLCSSLKRPVQL